jgi:hypothetical protein
MDKILNKKSINNNSNLHKLRISYYTQVKHFNDVYFNLGYNYDGKILKNMTSKELWSNPLNNPHFAKMEGIINFLIEQVKTIKKTFSLAHDIKSRNIN